jgi:hypothetical protein
MDSGNMAPMERKEASIGWICQFIHENRLRHGLKNIKQWAIPKGTTLLEGRTAAIEYTRSGYKPPYPIKPGQDFGYPGGARQKVIVDPSILYEP